MYVSMLDRMLRRWPERLLCVFSLDSPMFVLGANVSPFESSFDILNNRDDEELYFKLIHSKLFNR